MTRGDVIKLARQAGIGGMLTDLVCTMDELERFAGMVAAAEREALAQPSPAWHDAPTGPGLWLLDAATSPQYEWPVYRVTWPLNQMLIEEGDRWYGPIPEDTGAPT